MPVKGIMPRVSVLGFKAEGELEVWGTHRGRDEGISSGESKTSKKMCKKIDLSGWFDCSLKRGSIHEGPENQSEGQLNKRTV